MKNNKFLRYGIIFLFIYLILSLLTPKPQETPLDEGDFVIRTTQKEYEQGSLVSVIIRNNTQNPITIANECPNEPLSVAKKENNEWINVIADADIDCENEEDYVILGGNERIIHYDAWTHALFNETGTYKILTDFEIPTESAVSTETEAAQIQTITLESNEFEIKPQGFFGSVWTYGFYQPVYNILMFIISVLPGHSLGFGIILLTILIRTILLIPSHKAMKSQRKLQEIQPKLNKLKEKYKNNQEALARETMALWKENKVNPFGSCLPLLIQLPFLIALFYVIQTGLNPDNEYLFYSFLQDFSVRQIDVVFLGVLDLTKINAFVLPIIVGGFQFIQMKLAMMRNEKNKAQQKDKSKKPAQPEMEMANKMMIYFMPVMIAIFTASLPAGVGLYWSTSTLYGIGQQIVVNRQVEKESKGDAKVKVIKK